LQLDRQRFLRRKLTAAPYSLDYFPQIRIEGIARSLLFDTTMLAYPTTPQ
jgi:hypothetical protein